MVGSLTLLAEGVTAAQVEVATSFALAGVLGLNPIEATLSVVAVEVVSRLRRRLGPEQQESQQPEKLRRLAGVWSASYSVTVPPLQAMALHEKVHKIREDVAAFSAMLLQAFVATGAGLQQLAASLAVRSMPLPALSFLAGPKVVACGSNFCPSGMQAKDTVPLDVCGEALTCGEAGSVCCEETAPSEQMKAAGVDQPLAAFLVGIGGLVCCLSAVSCGMLRMPCIVRRLPRCCLSLCKCCIAEEEGRAKSTQLDASGRGVVAQGLSPSDLDLNVAQLVLNDLRGEWRTYDKGKVLPGIITLLDDGYTLYDDMHFDAHDLLANPGSILREDGWYVDMHRSDTDVLQWMKDDEHTVTWKRCKGVTDFAVGDIVEWVSQSSEVPQGAHGTVIGYTDTCVRVQFTGGTYDVKPSHLLTVKALGSAGKQAEPVKGLPALALCLEFKRLSLYADEVGKENTGLSEENHHLRNQLSEKVVKLDHDKTSLGKENTRLRTQLSLAEELRRELANSIAVSRENSALSLENERLRSRINQAEGFSRELSEMSQLSDRLTKHLQEVPANAPSTRSTPLTSPRASVTPRAMLAPVEGRPRPPMLNAQAAVGPWDNVVRLDDDESDDEYLAI